MAQETVVLQLELKGDKIVSAKLDGVNRKLRRSSQEVDRIGSRMARGFGSILNTISKALISGIAITAVFGTIFGIINSIRTATRTLFDQWREGVMAVTEFQERTIALQGILATTVEFSKDFAENFAQAGEVAQAVQIAFLQRSGEIIGTAEDAALVFQTLAGQGGVQLVKNTGELVDLAILFSNAVIAVTPGQEKQRQLASETAAFLRGSVRATDRLAKLLGLSAGDLEKIRQEALQSKNFLQVMEEKLTGMLAASDAFANTWTGVLNTIQDSITRLRIFSFELFGEEVLSRLRQIRDWILENEKLILNKMLAPFAAVGTVLLRIAETLAKDIIEQIPKISKGLSKLFDDLGVIIGAMNTWLGIWRVIDRIAAQFALEMTAIAVIVANAGIIINRKLSNPLADVSEQIKNIQTAIKLPTVDTGIGEEIKSIFSGEAFREGRKVIEDFRSDVEEETMKIRNNLKEIDVDEILGRFINARNVEDGMNRSLKMFEDKELSRFDKVTQAVMRRLRLFEKMFDKAGNILRRRGLPEVGVDPLGEPFRSGVDTDAERLERLRARNRAVIRRARLQRQAGSRMVTESFGIGEIRQQMEATRAMLGGVLSPEERQTLIGDLEALQGQLDSVAQAFLRVGDSAMQGFQSMVGAVFGANEEALGAMDLLKQGAQAIVMGVAQSMGQLFTEVFSGQDKLGDALKKMVGTILVQLGTLLVTAGTISLAAGTLGGFFSFLIPAGFNPAGIPASLAAIAVGSAAIAAGSAMGGGSGGAVRSAGGGVGAGAGAGGSSDIPEFRLNQRDINPQQTALNARLVNTLERMEAAPAGSVWTQGARENGGVLRVAGNEARNPKTAGNVRALGEAAMGGRG